MTSLAKKIGRVAVLMGGDSAEREVSLKSGQAALEALLRQGIDAFALDVHFNNSADYGTICQQLSTQKIDVAFIALHGRGGEDGVIQAVLESLNIAYTGCDVSASAIGMDKYKTKLLWAGSGLATPPFQRIKAEQIHTKTQYNIDILLTQLETSLGFPVIVKPAHEGSSIGINKANNKTELFKALKVGIEFDNEILVEQWVIGKEYTGAVLDDQVLPLIRLETSRDFYDYHAKYMSDDTLYHCPSGLSEELEQHYQSLILEAFQCLGAQAWGRVDFMCDASDKLWLIEINTVPGLTNHSLVPMAAQQNGIDFDELIVQIIKASLTDE